MLIAIINLLSIFIIMVGFIGGYFEAKFTFQDKYSKMVEH